MQTVASNPPKTKRNTKEKAQALRQTIDKRLDTLSRAIDQVRASELFEEYLATQARFHKYSWGNCMMIACQRPEATRVAGYKTWQSLKRQVLS